MRGDHFFKKPTPAAEPDKKQDETRTPGWLVLCGVLFVIYLIIINIPDENWAAMMKQLAHDAPGILQILVRVLKVIR